jgi:hypothetical protein
MGTVVKIAIVVLLIVKLFSIKYHCWTKTQIARDFVINRVFNLY